MTIEDYPCRELAELVIPHWKDLPTIEDLNKRFPPRDLPPQAIVARVAPSPTGMMHIGTIYCGLINMFLVRQQGGIYFLRVEDTDQKREVEGAFEAIVDGMRIYKQEPDEGFIRDASGAIVERGNYGPYLQSQRKEIYQACVFHLIAKGLAYPCFMSEQELEAIRVQQTAQRLRTGVYGTWALSRGLSLEEVKKRMDSPARESMVIRLRSPGSPHRTISWEDPIRGKITMPESDQDTVIQKSDGLPTYHFAHAVDDHFMGTTDVIRADEWLPSVPLHLQLFEVAGWKAPRYTHLSPLMKIDAAPPAEGEERVIEGGVSKRKLAKRKDPEANVRYYVDVGYPVDSVIEYLLNLANSNFEDWRKDHPTTPWEEFPFSVERLNNSGALTDFVKLGNVSKDVIARMSLDEVYTLGLQWAVQQEPALAELMKSQEAYAKAALNIEREGEKPSKRLETFSDLRSQLSPFFDELFTEQKLPFAEKITVEDRREILNRFAQGYDSADDGQAFFDKIKKITAELGFAAAVKEYKKNPDTFKGHVGDVAGVIRVALFGSDRSPDLWQVAQVMGKDRVVSRCQKGGN